VTAYFLDTITAVKPYPQEIGTAWVQSIDAAATAEGRLVEDPTNHLEHNPYTIDSERSCSIAWSLIDWIFRNNW
jgi:hypothetical protein